jgi:hypothetical protein
MSNDHSVSLQSSGSVFYTIDVTFLEQAPAEEETLLAGVEGMIRQAAAQEGASLSMNSPAPAAYGNWIGKTINAELRRGGQGRYISATVIPNGESAYLLRLMVPAPYLEEGDAVRRQIARALVLTPLGTASSAKSNQPSAANAIVGKWIHSDAGGSLEYQFLSDGSFRYEGEMYAPGFAHIHIKASGAYQASGESIAVVPNSVIANGSPGTIVSSSGRYDVQSDRIILRQEGSQSSTVFTRSR